MQYSHLNFQAEMGKLKCFHLKNNKTYRIFVFMVYSGVQFVYIQYTILFFDF